MKISNRKLRALVEVIRNCLSAEERAILRDILNDARPIGEIDLDALFETFEIEHYRKPEEALREGFPGA